MGTRYYTIQVDDIYLTRDGTETTDDVKTTFPEGLPSLKSNYTKTVRKDFRGNPVIEKTNVGVKGRTIVIRAAVNIPKTVGDDLITLHQAVEANDTPFRLQGEKTDSPSFDVMVLPAEPAFTWDGTDRSGNYKRAELRYITVGPYVEP